MRKGDLLLAPEKGTKLLYVDAGFGSTAGRVKKPKDRSKSSQSIDGREIRGGDVVEMDRGIALGSGERANQSAGEKTSTSLMCFNRVVLGSGERANQSAGVKTSTSLMCFNRVVLGSGERANQSAGEKSSTSLLCFN
jgi:hypothetical protein